MTKIVNRLLVISGYKKDGDPVWKKVGVVMEKNGKQFMLLDRCFNPAGIPSDNEQAIMITLAPPEYVERSKDEKPVRSNARQDEWADDDIPF
jgi:hypothetical protein